MFAMIFGHKIEIEQIVSSYWMVLPAAFLVSLLATPVCRALALKWNIVDRPNQTVKTHKTPTAYLGGVGILAGLLAGLLVGFWILRHNPPEKLAAVINFTHTFNSNFPSWLILLAIGLGATVACIVGLVDDLLDIRPWQKLLGQALASLPLVLVGVQPGFSEIFQSLGIELSDGWYTALSVPVVMFFILGATNSLNLIDGLDGLCAGVTTIITIGFAVLALILATWGHSAVGDPIRLIVCLSLAGGTLGFLPLNRHPAKIFMGDAGSMLLGFIAGTAMILFAKSIGRWSVASIIIFGLPILDTAVAIVRRALNHKPLFVSDRGHTYDQMMDRGMSQRKTVKTCYVLAGIYALVGLGVAYLRFRYAVVAFVAVVIISAVMVTRAGFLRTTGTRRSAS